MLLNSCWVPVLCPLRLRSIRREILRSEAATAEKEKQKLEAEQKAIFDTKRLSKYQYLSPFLTSLLTASFSLAKSGAAGSVKLWHFLKISESGSPDDNNGLRIIIVSLIKTNTLAS